MPPERAYTPIHAADYRRTPWKNGGGVTVDIADAYHPGAEPGGWTGMIWRLGRTRIETPAPFSDLTGNDRILAVIGGRGLVLRRPDGGAIEVQEPFRPVSFPGEWEIRSELNDGPVEVLNLMGARAEVRLDLRFVDGGEADLDAELVVVFAPTGDVQLRIGGRELLIPNGDAVRLDGHAGSCLDVRSGQAAVASISPV